MFRKTQNCAICQGCKIARAYCRAKQGKPDDTPEPPRFGDAITADHTFLADEEASTVASAFQRYWLLWAPPPDEIVFDSGTEFKGMFKDLAELWTQGSLLEIGAFLLSTDLPTDMLVTSIRETFPAHIAPPATHDMVPHHMTILALVGSARLPANEHAKTLLSIDAPEEVIEAMADIGSFEDTSDYYYLSDRRVWGTTKRLGCFDLPRYSLDKPLTEHLWFHWEYHACNTPIWRDRFARYKGVPNHKTLEIDFPDEDAEEEFFQTWNVLPDEQSKRVQELASGQIVMVPYSRWFRETFGKPACIAPTDPILYIPTN